MFLALALAAGESSGGGIGVATEAEPELAGPPTEPTGAFHVYRAGTTNQLRHRDVEFLLDGRYGIGLTSVVRANLDFFGNTLCVTHNNPWNAPLSDMRLFYDYFNRIGARYSTNPGDTLTRFGNAFGGSVRDYPMRDRVHGDIYLLKPGGGFSAGGNYPTLNLDAAEDSTTGIPRGAPALGGNAVDVVGPANPADPAWAQPGLITNIGVIHELAHSLPSSDSTEKSLQLGFDTEFMSAAAEIMTGMQDTTAVFETQYTWSLISERNFGDGPDCNKTRHVGRNYQARTLLAAYIASQFRGLDTTFTAAGIADDMLRKWVLAYERGSTSLKALDSLVSNDSCYTCANRVHFQGLSDKDRAQLILHNWRVANYVNNAFIAEGQYGYPPHLGFAPAKQVKAWQDLDGPAGRTDCYKDDMIAIPPIVTMRPVHAYRETTFSRERSFSRGPGYETTKYPLVLQPLGSEYWVVRADSAALGAVPRDLLVNIRSVTPVPLCGGKRRLMVSAVGYAHVDPDSIEGTLWSRPQWANYAGAPIWTNVDSISNDLVLKVPGFGTTSKSAVVVISLGDSDSLGGGYNFGGYQEAIEYRISFALQDSGAIPVPKLLAGGPQNESAPSWAPDGGRIAFMGLRFPAIVNQVYVVSASGGTPVALAISPMAQFSPDWSPRGGLVAYVQETGMGNCEIFAKDPDTTTTTAPMALTTLGGHSEVPSFQPNGQGIAFLFKAHPAESTFKLMWMKKDGSGLRQVADFGSGTTPIVPPRWSADGQTLWVVKNNRLHSVPVGGGTLSDRGDVATDVGNGFDLHPSPNRIAFNQSALAPPRSCGLGVGVNRLLAINSSAGGPDTSTLFYRRSGSFRGPRYAPDGVQLAYASNQNGNLDLYVGRTTVNRAPWFSNSSTSDVGVPAGVPYTRELLAIEPNQESMTFSASYLPPGSTFTGNTFSWPNPTGAVGDDYFVVFRVRDPSAGADFHVVRFVITAPVGSGCPVADVLTRDGWKTENSVLERTLGDLRWDVVPLRQVPELVNGRYEIRIRENESEKSVIDEARLLVVDHDEAVSAYPWKDGQVLKGMSQPPLSVVTTRGVDVRGLVDGVGPDYFLGGSGDTLLVDFGTAYVAPPGGIDPIGYEGEGKDEGGGGASLRGAVSDASAAATPFAVDREVLRSSGFVVQGWTAEHGWRDARHVYPRESYSTSVVDTLDSGLVRLVFIGRHKLRRIEKIVPIGVAPLTPAALVSARHAKMGDVSRDLKASDHQTTVLTYGDTVSLSFAAAPAVARKKRSFFLGLRGFYTTTVANSTSLRSTGRLPLSLAQNRPNPFGSSTRIDLALPSGMHVTLRMFDVQGRTVRTLLDGHLEAGRHDVEWDGRGRTGNHLAPGVYLCVMETPAGRMSRRVVLMP